jgi:hypothetical protein
MERRNCKDMTRDESFEYVKMWARKHLRRDDICSVTVKEAHKAYEDFCETARVEPYPVVWFSRALSGLGFKSSVLWYRSGAKRAFKGYKIV